VYDPGALDTRLIVPLTEFIEAPDEKVPPEVPVNVTEAVPIFEQNGVPVYDIIADGIAVTVTVALPTFSDAIDVQVPLVNVLMV